ncbi:ATP-binding cassette domain-containing protein [bacterium]|nr:ATP-binding cassette domain-containing protein [bacterium]
MAAARPVISLNDVSIRRGDVAVLDRVRWELREGESWLVRGGNGSGKTTFLRLVQGDLWPDAHAGTRLYHLPGEPPCESPVALRGLIRTVSAEQQDRYVRNETRISVADVVRSGHRDVVYPQGEFPPAVEARVAPLLELVGMTELADRPFLETSHGQARRALIARALLSEPRILILDEVFNGLDPSSRDGLMGLVERLIHSGVQVLMTSHRPGEVTPAIANEIELAAGRVVYTGRRRGTGVAPPPAPSRPQGAPLSRGEVLLAVTNTDVAIEGTPILRGIDWEWRRGEHWLITGPNGSGKSTFLRLLYGDLVPTLGGVVRRLDLPELSSIWEIRDVIGYVAPEFQARYALPLAAVELVASGETGSIGLYGERDAEALERAQLMMNRLGIAHLSNRPITGLSYGQMRQALVARAMIRRPRLLLLDEPFNGLDAGWCRRLAEVLEEAVQDGIHLLAVSHHEEEAAFLFNRHAHFDSGRLVLED